MPSRGLLLLAFVTLVAVVACWIAIDGRYRLAAFESREGKLMFPEFAGQASETATIEVARPNGSFVLARRDGHWTNMALGGFPVEPDLAESALAVVAGLKAVEPKTSREQLYPKLQVEDVARDSKSTRLTFKDSSGRVLADLIVGMTKEAKIDLDRNGLYVRRPKEDRAWLAEGVLDVRRDAADWSDHEIVDIAARSVAALTVVHADGEVVDLHRARPEDRKLTLRNLPAGAEIEHQHQIDFMSGLLRELTFSDAKPAQPTGGEAPAFEVTVQTGDRLRILLSASEAAEDGSLWAQVDAEVAKEAEASEQSRRNAESIRSRFQGWSLKLPRKFSDKLKIRLSDILGRTSNGEGQEP